MLQSSVCQKEPMKERKWDLCVAGHENSWSARQVGWTFKPDRLISP